MMRKRTRTPTPAAWRRRTVWRSGRRTGSRGGRAAPPPPPPPRPGRGRRVTRVGSSPSSKNDTRWLLAVRHGQYDRQDRRCARLQLWRQRRTAGAGRRTREAVRTAGDRTEELKTRPRRGRARTVAPARDGPGNGLVLRRYRLIRRLGAGRSGAGWADPRPGRGRFGGRLARPRRAARPRGRGQAHRGPRRGRRYPRPARGEGGGP